MSDSMEGDTSEDDEEELENLTSKRKVKHKGPTNKIKKAKTIVLSNLEISDDEYRELLQDISEWYDGNGCIGMLKVLYKDHVTNANTLHNATKMRDLLDNLHNSGHLSPTDLSILYDTVNVTKQFGFKPKNKKLLPLFQNVRSFEISKFTSHRQKLVKLGMALIQEDVAALDSLFNTQRKKYEDSWHLIKDLEHRTVICEGKMMAFIKKLSKFQLHLAVKALTEDIENASSGQASGQGILNVFSYSVGPCNEDKVIRKYLLSSQQKVCRTSNQFTPAIINTEHQVDIVNIFTDLDLLKISKNREKEDAAIFTDLDQLKTSKNRKKADADMFTGLSLPKISKNSNKKDATLTTLKQVLDDIESTPACKALIEGESGIGKSTLLRYVAYNWAKKESDEIFKGKIVFLVNIQDIDKGETILDAILNQINLQGFQLETGLQKDPLLIKRFIWNHSNEIVLLLDGLDELKDSSESPIRIFKNQEMCECKVILTSRPENINDFINASNLHVEVKGFSTDNISKYIKKHFAFFREPLLGDSLIEELDSNDKYKYKEVFSMCKNPLLLLSVCIMWEERKHLPADKTDLFKEVFRCILNQFIDKQAIKEQKISIFENTPERFVNAMALLGKYFYKGLKRNQLSINRREIEEDKEMVALALKLGFVYKDTPKLKSNFEEIFTTRHKLIVESLVGFYLCKLCETQGSKDKFSKGMERLFEPLTDNEWKMISRSKHLHMTKVFTIGFLGSNAGIFLSHWITNYVSTYRSLMEYLRCIKEEHKVTVEKAVIDHMTRKNLEIEPHIYKICKSLRKFIHYITPEVDISQREHFIKLMIRIHTYLPGAESKVINAVECFWKEMSSEEKGRMLAHILIAVSDQNLILEKISSMICVNDINYLTDECQRLYFKYDITECRLSSLNTASYLVHLFSNASQLSNFKCSNCITGAAMNEVIRDCLRGEVKLELNKLSFSDNNISNIDWLPYASLFITPKLNTLEMSNCSLSGVVMNDMIRACSSRGVNLELVELDISDNNLSNIRGSSFASLLAITPKLNRLFMVNCSLSGVILNDMIRECSSREMKLELELLDINDNNLSNIDGSSFASLFITPKLNVFYMNNCSLSGVIMNYMIRECFRSGVKLELESLDISGNNLSNIDGSSFASLFITPKLNLLNMNNCSLSNVIMNDMIRGCSNRRFKLELESVGISGNNLSNIDGSSFASLFITPKLNLLYMNDCSLSGIIMNDMIRECSNRGVKLEIQQLTINDNNLSNIDGSSFTSLFITPKLKSLGMRNCSLSDVVMNDMIRECSGRGVKLEVQQLYISGNNLSNIDGYSFASLFITPKLYLLDISNCTLSGGVMNDMIRECSSRGVKLELQQLYINDNNLSNINGSSFASLFFTPKLNVLYMANCSLSGCIINNMIRECSNRGVKLNNLNMLSITGNNLHDIDGSLFTSLIITPKLNTLLMSKCSLSVGVINIITDCSSREVKLELEELYISANDLSKINSSSFASLFITPKLNELVMNNCNLSGVIMNDMIRECCSRGVKLELVRLDISGNNLNDIDGSLFASLINSPKLNTLLMSDCSLSSVIINDMIREYSSRGVKLELMVLYISGNNLSNIDGSSFASLFISHKLSKILMNNCSLSGVHMNDMIRECFSRGVKFDLQEIDISGNNLSNIDGSAFASLFITPKMNTLDMSNCSLSGVIMNDMIRECCSRGVKLELNELYISGNNLSNIDGSAFASLFITPKLNTLDMSNCSLSGVIMNDIFRECSSRGVKLELNELYISGNNLSNINSSEFASLFITTKLNTLDMSNCSLSGVIMNDMITECSSREMKLELVGLDISGNNLSNMNGFAFASLFITPKLNTLLMNNCTLSGVIINDMIRECSIRGVKLELQELYISGNNLSVINGSSFASIFITPKLNTLDMSNCSLSVVIINNIIRECSSRGVKFEFKELYIGDNNLSNIDWSSFASLFFTPKLNTLNINNCSLLDVFMNDMIRECSSRGVNLELKELYIGDNNLSNIDWSLFAPLFITPKLIILNMSYCNLSGVIMNDIISECLNRGVNLEIVQLYISGNNISDIDGSSFASLFITPKLNTLEMSNCSLSGVNINYMIEECSRSGVNLELVGLDMSGNNLSNIDGFSFASLFITPKLHLLYMSNCSLSGVIMNDMIRECSSRRVNLELRGLDISDNNLSYIDGCLFTSLLVITPKLNHLNMSNCRVTSIVMNIITREFCGRVMLELEET
ncbi:uncharacterized protein LOC117106077 [Anneissia japonica]|uniref:uncharacterized protein LOC117106077 n=1 Tax=Anneissia japonica TaxID=1529436 RepID=UPI001425AD16|nr:uncharacterized protein LOC117106077 [Anneissia japonica]XP_033103304.1 uncharacterized protein LOC117106077 [Anneissia japonica]XP_033103305.1 uncharacterized protein LOC117106077 [Anneissia japonica]